MLVGDDQRQLVVKLSHEAETATNIDLEESAARWAVTADPGLPLSTPLTVRGSQARHGVVRHPATGAAHFLRAYDRLPGQAGLVGTDLAPDTVVAYGAVTARTARALRGFFHPAAGRRLLWHVEERDRTRTLARHIDDPTTRRLVEAAFDDFEERVAPTWPALRAQVVHGDLTLDNLLVDDGEVSGVLDLGDLAHSTLVSDIAAAFGSLSATFEGAALFRTLRLFLDGYRSVTPLEPAELAALGDTIAVRAAITLCISHWRAADHPENAAYIRGWDEISVSLLRQFEELGHEEVTRRLGGPSTPPETTELIGRRAAVFGTALAELTYSEPLHLVSGSGATLTDSSGETFIDAYNNVPVVGHAHARVSGAIADQARLLSTNLRYLHPRAIELAERLVDSMPGDLDTVLLVNSGSEATDLAWRLATAATGRTGALVTEFAYHGVTTASAALSPEEWRDGRRPGHVERFAAPGGPRPDPSVVRGRRRQVAGGRARAGPRHRRPGVHQRRHPRARCGVPRSPGRRGQGRWRPGRGRRGAGGIRPDRRPPVVVRRRRAGPRRGHPRASRWATATRSPPSSPGAATPRRSAARQSSSAPSPAAPWRPSPALAVLDVIDDHDLVAHAAAMGVLLRGRLREATAACPAVHDVRGRGLIVGVDLAGTPSTVVAAVQDRVREHGVLIGTTGPASDVLKIRPPLAISRAQVARVADVVAAAVHDLTGS